MKKLFIAITICLCSVADAQTPKPTAAPKPVASSHVPSTKVVIAYFNYDTLLARLPGYKEKADSANAVSKLALMKAELNKKEAEYDSLSSGWSKPIKAIKEQEIFDLQQLIQNYVPPKVLFNTMAFDLKLTEAVDKISKAKGYSAALDSKTADAFVLWTTPGIEFVDMTADICAELGITKGK